jgi:magnesium chelatase family protein
VTAEGRNLLHEAAERLLLSARAYHRVLKVARTIADLADDDAVGTTAVGEALRYRPVVARFVAPPPKGSAGAGAA